MMLGEVGRRGGGGQGGQGWMSKGRNRREGGGKRDGCRV